MGSPETRFLVTGVTYRDAARIPSLQLSSMEASMPSNITQFHHRAGGYQRGAGHRLGAATRYVLATAVAGAFIALGTPVHRRTCRRGWLCPEVSGRPRGYAYNTQANPNYGFGPLVRVHPHDVIWATGSSAATRIRSSAARSCVTTTAGPTSPWTYPIQESRRGDHNTSAGMPIEFWFPRPPVVLSSGGRQSPPHSSASSLRAAAFSRQ